MSKQAHDRMMYLRLPSIRERIQKDFNTYAVAVFEQRFYQLAMRHPTEAPLRIVQRVKKLVASMNSYEAEHKDDSH